MCLGYLADRLNTIDLRLCAHWIHYQPA